MYMYFLLFINRNGKNNKRPASIKVVPKFSKYANVVSSPLSVTME